LAKRFEAAHPGTHVDLVFDSSATLATQVNEGAPDDVLATADTKTMDSVTKAGNNAAPAVVFATNVLVLAVPAANPGKVGKVSDLDRPWSTWVQCVSSAPCGRAADALVAANKVSSKPKSLEVDVKAVLTKVTSGEADAGFVYATDARSAGAKVTAIPVPGAAAKQNKYAVTVAKQTRDQA